MVNNSLDISIDTLKEQTVLMMEKCEEAIEKSVTCMIEKDLEGARKVVEDDEEINKLREEIRDKSIELIVLKQPMARDLRFIYSLGNISIELERIGDYAANIAREMLKIGGEAYIKELIDIPKMAKECKSMMSQTREALILFDASIAYDVGTKDDIVDGLYEQIQIDCLKIMHENSNTIDQGVKLLLIGRYLERIGDHITNVCEKIIFAIEGKMVEIG
ncbi:TPA: phosphate signaling complex protein PhoU [Clostridioides difficile]|nr:phosphate signaling complex protein PhoU [Clostridioides difficile]HCQ5481494.1 phosphate signaling complex protein PhoU [Clostridioides difficile]HCQ5814912.1 phosphate signaling complex protein PhoU [Clostridioides difficile]HCQ5818212.1 phosphate signaling complex protein PhoU [Clostridioides difficile]HCQ5834715.1 phosphate signaling complex protein PhoU [Clostridioides difficile]